jgi:hypothetical protein
VKKPLVRPILLLKGKPYTKNIDEAVAVAVKAASTARFLHCDSLNRRGGRPKEQYGQRDN